MDITDHAKAMRRANWKAKKEAMKDGNVRRAQTFKSKKQYRRKSKYGNKLGEE